MKVENDLTTTYQPANAKIFRNLLSNHAKFITVAQQQHDIPLFSATILAVILENNLFVLIILPFGQEMDMVTAENWVIAILLVIVMEILAVQKTVGIQVQESVNLVYLNKRL